MGNKEQKQSKKENDKFEKKENTLGKKNSFGNL